MDRDQLIHVLDLLELNLEGLPRGLDDVHHDVREEGLEEVVHLVAEEMAGVQLGLKIRKS